MSAPVALEGVYQVRTTQDWADQVEVYVGSEQVPDIMTDTTLNHVTEVVLEMKGAPGTRLPIRQWTKTGGVLSLQNNTVVWSIDKTLVASLLPPGRYTLRFALVWSDGTDEDLFTASAEVVS